MRLREHPVVLRGQRIVLRPMTEDDWELLLRWNSDPEVLYDVEVDDVGAYTLEQVQQLYRTVSQDAFCFVIEVEGRPIGECWLQRMNLERICQDYPGLDCRRIDLMIGEKAFWGQGHGTEAIRLLSRFAFDQEQADLVFGCDVAEDNLASRRAFEKAGYTVAGRIEQPAGSKARVRCDLVRRRGEP